MRERTKESAFLRKTLNIYNAQVRRAASLGVKEIPYTLEELREWLKPWVNKQCRCGQKLTLKKLAVDHDVPVSRGGNWQLYNLRPMCSACNYRKGKLTGAEWVRLQDVLAEFSDEGRADIYRRLTIGGKWSFK